MNGKVKINKKGCVSEIPLGYWKRGDHQYWHIKDDSALLINLERQGYHYDGNGSYIFIKMPDPTIQYHAGRI